MKENRSSQTEKPALMPFLTYTFCATKFLKLFSIDSCFNIRRIIRLKRKRSLKGIPNHFAFRMNEFNQEFLFPVATEICLRASRGNMTQDTRHRLTEWSQRSQQKSVRLQGERTGQEIFSQTGENVSLCLVSPVRARSQSPSQQTHRGQHGASRCIGNSHRMQNIEEAPRDTVPLFFPRLVPNLRDPDRGTPALLLPWFLQTVQNFLEDKATFHFMKKKSIDG